MPPISRTVEAPKVRNWRIDIDMRHVDATKEELFQWCKENCKKPVYWTETNFGGLRHGGVQPSGQRHFRDGYMVTTFWFTRHVDAVKFKIVWEPWMGS